MPQPLETPADTAGHAMLRPVLGPFAAAAIVVGGVIGSGIFLKPQEIASTTGGFLGFILLLWAVCGLVNLCGALALAELSAMMPHAGGTYVFLREAYGKLWAFLWGWAEFWVIRSGAIAALAVALAGIMHDMLGQWSLIPGHEYEVAFEVTFAVVMIAMLTAINILGTRWGGATQNITTVIKAGFVGFLALLPFLASGAETVNVRPLWPSHVDTGLLAATGAALAAIMWAYDGWGMVTVVAEEIRDPARNVPRALIGGVLFLIVLYVAANLAYHLTLPSAVIADPNNNNTAMVVTEKLLGPWGTQLVLAMTMVSIFGALNGNILVGPRVVFAVARDHRMYEPLRRVDPRFGTPALSIAALSGWSCILILANTVIPVADTSLFTLLTNYVVFGGSMFYFSAVLAVFVLRKRQPDAERPYRTWGYPWVPLIFVTFYVYFLIAMFWARPHECLRGLVLIALGVAWYFAARAMWPGSHGGPPATNARTQ